MSKTELFWIIFLSVLGVFLCVITIMSLILPMPEIIGFNLTDHQINSDMENFLRMVRL